MSERLTAAEVTSMAALARLGLTKSETAAAARDLAGILEHFSQIQRLDTHNVPTSDDVTGLRNVVRPDAAAANDLCAAADVRAAAPATQHRKIKVKAVFAE